jgi:cold shock CspA family protein
MVEFFNIDKGFGFLILGTNNMTPICLALFHLVLAFLQPACKLSSLPYFSFVHVFTLFCCAGGQEVGGAEIFIHKSEIIGAVKLLSNGEAVTYELGTVENNTIAVTI